MPKDNKAITNIKIDFNNNLKGDVLSEGEKKMLLIMLILEVVGDENSLILLDEPDSHIHLSRKEEIQKLLSNYSNRDNIITTHSPTLTHCFDSKHITMLTKNVNNDAQVEKREKQEIVHQLTDGIWNYQEQNIFLNSKKDILLVEGKYDEIYISEAIKRLQRYKKYQSLDFVFLPMGGADGLSIFINKFTPRKNQKIIALLDRDSAGLKPIENILGKKIDIKTFDFEKKGDVHLVCYPYKKGWVADDFIVEDYFSKSLIQQEVLKLSKRYNTSFKTYPRIRESIKSSLPKKAQKSTFADKHFNGFKILLDKLIEIKKQH